MVHQIATGRWSAGERVPSVRRAETLWGVNRLTVLKAYRRLVSEGILTGGTTAGFFVATSRRLEELTRQRRELADLHREVTKLIRRRSRLSPLAALRGLAQLAEVDARESPECAFVECTRYQARGHAQEIEQRLGTPCLALTLDELAAPPASVRLLVTTAFHREEVTGAARRRGLAFLEVAIAMDTGFVARRAKIRELVFLGVSLAVIEQVAADLRDHVRSPVRTTQQEVRPGDLDRALETWLGRRAAGRAVILSPTLWEAIPDRWRHHPAISPAASRIADAAWPDIAEALGAAD
jgi:DNA-binding transcriptional regulator YhcF (GntR family)